MAIYEVAFHLRLPVSVVYEFPYDEFLGWLNYFERRPIGWRDDLRAYPLLAAWGCDAKPEAVFQSLQPIFAASKAEEDKRVKLQGSYLLQKLLSAQGGEAIPL